MLLDETSNIYIASVFRGSHFVWVIRDANYRGMGCLGLRCIVRSGLRASVEIALLV